MKQLFSLYVALCLSAYASTAISQETSQSSTVDIPTSLKAFRDICLKNAPDFKNGEQAAKEYGIKAFEDFTFMKAGFTGDRSMSVQLQDKECAITTDPQTDKQLTQQFLQTVNTYAGTTLTGVPAKITVNGQTYIITHDRKGGEAFVMLKQ